MRLALLFVAGAAVMTHAATRTVDFSDDVVDQPPKGFAFGHTVDAGKPGKWIVQGCQWPPVQVFFNGSKPYDVEDATFTQAGKVGGWTRRIRRRISMICSSRLSNHDLP